MNNINPSQPTAETTSAISKPSEFWTVFLLSLFLGALGIHRFYARKFKSGIVQLLTCGGLGVWSFIDVIIILLSKFKNSNGVIFNNPKPKVTWGIFVAVCVLGIIGIASDNQNGNGSSSSGASASSSSWGSSDEKKLVGTYQSVQPPYVLQLSYGGEVKMQNIDSGDVNSGKWAVNGGTMVATWDSNGSTTTFDINSDGSLKKQAETYSDEILFVKTQQ